jgi:hypothetical protein
VRQANAARNSCSVSTVRAPIGVAEANARRRAAFDEEHSAMGSLVMHAAQGEQMFDLVPATFGAQIEVMQIEEARIPAAGHAAAPVVAQQHGAA